MSIPARNQAHKQGKNRKLTCEKFSCILNLKPVVALFIVALFTQAVALAQSVVEEKNSQSRPLHVGLLPHLSSNMLVKKYQPLIDYLRKNLDRPVIVNTAPNFRAYVDRTAENRYDIYLTAPHFAAFHARKNGHEKLTRFSRELYGVIVVKKDSGIKQVRELRGTTVVTPSPIAAISMLGEIALIEEGLKINKDVQLKFTKSHTNALVSVADDKADAAIVGVTAFDLMPEKVKQNLRVLSKTPTIPHMFFLSSSKVTKPDSEKFKTALLDFANDENGKLFFADAAFGDIVPATDKDIARMDSMVPLLETRLTK